jgi:hypothetical protein
VMVPSVTVSPSCGIVTRSIAPHCTERRWFTRHASRAANVPAAGCRRSCGSALLLGGAARGGAQDTLG